MADFIDDCTSLVQAKIDSITNNGNNLKLPIKLTLEETVMSTQSPDDFDHRFIFTLEYPEDTNRVLSTTLTMDEDKPIGREDMNYLGQYFLYLPRENPHLKLRKEHLMHNKKRYSGAITISYNQ